VDINALGLKIKELRIAAEVSQDGLAQSSGVARNSINELEQGRGNPTIGTIKALESALGARLIDNAADASQSQSHAEFDVKFATQLLQEFDSASPERQLLGFYILTKNEAFLTRFEALHGRVPELKVVKKVP